MKQITTDVFEAATASTARVIGRNENIRVVFKGDTAMNNGKEIVLPKMAEGSTLSEEDASVVRGYADHETLHSLLTDMRNGSDEKAKAGPLLAAMMNAIEDVRIENGGAQLYAGMPKNISATAEATAARVMERVSPEAMNDWKQVLPVATTWAGRIALGTAGDETRKAFDALGDDVKAKAQALANMVLTLDTGCERGFVEKAKAYDGCMQGVSLAKRFYNDMKEEDEKKEDKSGGDKPSTGSKGGPKPTSSGGSEEDGSSGSGGSHERNDDGSAGTSDAVGGVGGGAGRDEADVEDRVIDPGLDAAASEVFDKINASKTSDSYVVMSKENDVEIYRNAVLDFAGGNKEARVGSFRVRRDRDVVISTGLAEYQGTLQSISGTINVMKRKLERALMAKERRFYETGFQSGQFDSKRALNVVLGNDNVFRRKTHGQDIATAVTVLVDLSGSMSGCGKSTVAMQSCIALCEALEKTHVKYEVLGFRTGRICERPASDTSDTRYARMDSLEGFVFKAFDEPLRQAKWFVGYLRNAVGGANADGESVRWAADRLLKQRVNKRVMLVLSDGEPSCDTERGDLLYKHLTDTNKWVESQGVELVGIGIMSAAVKRFYRQWVMVDSVDALAKKVIDQVGKMIVGGNFHADNSELMEGDAKSAKKRA